jgi:hypothetical protein
MRRYESRKSCLPTFFILQLAALWMDEFKELVKNTPLSALHLLKIESFRLHH